MNLHRMLALAAGLAAVTVAPNLANADDYGKGQPGESLKECPGMDLQALTEDERSKIQAEGCPEPDLDQMPVRGEDAVDADADVDVEQPSPAPSAQPMPMPQQPQQPVVVQPRVVVQQAPMPMASVEEDEDADEPLLTPFGLAIAVGGGVSNFTEDELDDRTDVGGAWDARLIIGTRSPIAFEAAYVGSAQEITGLGLDPDAVLVSNGAEGALRLNIGTYPIQPFVFGGGSWVRYDLTNDDFNTSDVSSSDNVFAIPVGGGIAGRYRGAILDARFTYRETFDNDLLRTPTGSAADADLNNWSATGRVGFEF